MSDGWINTLLDIWILLLAFIGVWRSRYWRKRCEAAESEINKARAAGWVSDSE